jgi:hypothetical protein
MLVIYCSGSWQLISCRQDLKAAWRHAHKLQHLTGLRHFVGRL